MTLDMADMSEVVKIFTTIALFVFVALVALALSRMSWRYWNFRRAGVKTPWLLKRDMVLFGTFAAYFGLVLIFRMLGFVLTQNPVWIIPTTTVVLLAMAYWVWVEFHLDG